MNANLDMRHNTSLFFAKSVGPVQYMDKGADPSDAPIGISSPHPLVPQFRSSTLSSIGQSGKRPSRPFSTAARSHTPLAYRHYSTCHYAHLLPLGPLILVRRWSIMSITSSQGTRTSGAVVPINASSPKKRKKLQRTDINLAIIVNDPTPDMVGTTSREHTRRRFLFRELLCVWRTVCRGSKRPEHLLQFVHYPLAVTLVGMNRAKNKSS